jgi:hypothetical protein
MLQYNVRVDSRLLFAVSYADLRYYLRIQLGS